MTYKGKTMFLTEDELMGACSVLNEVRNGLPKTGAVAEYFPGYTESSGLGNLAMTLHRRLKQARTDAVLPTDLFFTVEELDVLRRAIDVVLQEIEDPEFHTRLGLFRHEMMALRSKLA